MRSAFLAEAGLTGDADIFGRAVTSLFNAGKEPGDDPMTVPIEVDLKTLSRKLYPCCYMNHRLISAGFAAREQLPDFKIPADAKIKVVAPFGSTVPLRVDDPKEGLRRNSAVPTTSPPRWPKVPSRCAISRILPSPARISAH